MSDRIKNGLMSIVRHMLKPTDYHAMYEAKVLSQNSSGNLDLQPSDTRLPAMTDVPIRYGIPGISAAVRAGSYVMVQFEGGNPSRPVATVWNSASVEYVVIGADKTYIGANDSDAYPIARVGDIVECLMPPMMPVSGQMSGQAFTGMLTVIDPIYGVITSGSAMGCAK